MWDEPITRENLDEFYFEFAPAAYKSAYRILGDTTRSENVLSEAFIEIYHQRNAHNSGNPVFVFSDILERKVAYVASKYPIPENIKIYARSLDEFTKNSILSEIHRKIDSLPFRAVDFLMSSSSPTHNITRASGITKYVGNLSKSGITLVLIIQLIIVSVIVGLITYAGAMNTFGVRDIIPVNEEQYLLSIDKQLIPILPYLPIDLSGQSQLNQGSSAQGSNESDQSDVSDNSDITNEESSGETDLSATMG